MTNYIYTGSQKWIGRFGLVAQNQVLSLTDDEALTVVGNTDFVKQSITAVPGVLVDGATVTQTMDPAKPIQNAEITLGGNRTMAFSGLQSGMTGVLVVKQDGTGNRTLALPATSKVSGGGAGAITLSTAASKIDVLRWYYDGTNILWFSHLNFT